MRFLILHFDAPMQSWGASLSTGVREAGQSPTLSGVVGLVANALGRDRDEDMSDLVRPMAVRTDRAGIIERDFQTIGVGTGIGKIGEDGEIPSKVKVDKDGKVSARYYQADAAHVVALAEAPGALSLESVADALTTPKRALYLGRRAFPIAEPIVREGIVEADDIVSALAAVPAPERRDEHRTLTVETSISDPNGRRAFDIPRSFGRYSARYLTTIPAKEDDPCI